MGNELITGAAIATLVAGVITLFNSNKQIRDSLDSKSGWRKDIFNVASKTFITTDDVYLILAALRFLPHDKWSSSFNLYPTDFKEMTSYMYDHLTKIVENPKYKLIDLRDDDNNCQNEYSFNIQRGSLKLTNMILKESVDIEPIKLIHKDSEKVRLFAKYLLKHHWEDLGNGYIGRVKYRVLEEEKIMKRVYIEIEKLK